MASSSSSSYVLLLPSTSFLQGSNPKSYAVRSTVKIRQSVVIRISASSASLYDVLGIQTGATCKEIKTAYRRLARLVHPDAAAYGGGRSVENSGEEFIRIHAAYSTLSDPVKRADYDMSRLLRDVIQQFSVDSNSNSHWPSSKFSSYAKPRRMWQTDQCW